MLHSTGCLNFPRHRIKSGESEAEHLRRDIGKLHYGKDEEFLLL